MSEWITIPGWSRFQHYRDRDPLWIKVYLELRSKDEWRQLTLAERGLLVCLWIEYAASRGQVRVSDVPQRVAQKNLRRSLDSLQAAGFIEVSASKPLALARARALAREEKEKEPPKPPARRRGADGRKITGWKRVRGSHGETVVPDPFGCDAAPVR